VVVSTILEKEGGKKKIGRKYKNAGLKTAAVIFHEAPTGGEDPGQIPSEVSGEKKRTRRRHGKENLSGENNDHRKRHGTRTRCTLRAWSSSSSDAEGLR